MAYVNVTNPNNAAPNTIQIGNVNGQYVFGGIQKPDFSDYITYRFPQYTITTLLNRIGRKNPVAGNDFFSWFEKGKFRQSVTSTTSTASGATGATSVTVAYAAGAGVQATFLVGDVIRFENNEYAIVTATTGGTGAGASGTLACNVVSSGAGTSSLITNGMKFAHLYNLQQEYSDSPSGRVWAENQVNEYLGIMRRSVTCSTTQGSNMKWVKKSDSEWSYYYINEMETMQEMAMDREMYILAGKATTSGTTNNVFSGTTRLGGNGILPRVIADGVVGTYSSAIAETDLAEQIRLMCLNSQGSEFTVLCGSSAYADAQFALRDYTLNGGISFGVFGNEGLMTGINITKYKFMDKVLNFVLYYPFANEALFPAPATSGINWDKAMLFLNMGTDDRGNPLINLRYKQDLLGQSLEFRRTVQEGITSPEAGASASRSNGRDGFTVDFYSSIGVELRAANNHGLLYAA
ncbi:MAG: hypothetical protein FJ351_02455 [Sphingomonadales bacterium]|nr:hypothetical protein [Sphingomonadales bacterium]